MERFALAWTVTFNSSDVFIFLLYACHRQASDKITFLPIKSIRVRLIYRPLYSVLNTFYHKHLPCLHLPEKSQVRLTVCRALTPQCRDGFVVCRGTARRWSPWVDLTELGGFTQSVGVSRLGTEVLQRFCIPLWALQKIQARTFCFRHEKMKHGSPGSLTPGTLANRVYIYGTVVGLHLSMITLTLSLSTEVELGCRKRLEGLFYSLMSSCWNWRTFMKLINSWALPEYFLLPVSGLVAFVCF